MYQKTPFQKENSTFSGKGAPHRSSPDPTPNWGGDTHWHDWHRHMQFPECWRAATTGVFTCVFHFKSIHT